MQPESTRSDRTGKKSRAAPMCCLARQYVFTVAAGILPAVEPGILPGGMGQLVREGPCDLAPAAGRQDAALYSGQDDRCYAPAPHFLLHGRG